MTDVTLYVVGVTVVRHERPKRTLHQSKEAKVHHLVTFRRFLCLRLEKYVFNAAPQTFAKWTLGKQIAIN